MSGLWLISKWPLFASSSFIAASWKRPTICLAYHLLDSSDGFDTRAFRESSRSWLASNYVLLPLFMDECLFRIGPALARENRLASTYSTLNEKHFCVSVKSASSSSPAVLGYGTPSSEFS